MLEVEFVSELMITLLDGLQDKKKSIDTFYTEFEEQFPKQEIVAKRFRGTIDALLDSVGEVLGTTEFVRPPLFYSLFCAVAHRLYGLPKQQLPSPHKNLSVSEKNDLLEAVHTLSGFVSAARQDEQVPERHRSFVSACLRQTDNIRPRQVRLAAIYRAAFG